jgi:hypothetical protein
MAMALHPIFQDFVDDLRERNRQAASVYAAKRKLAALLRRLDALVAQQDSLPEPRQWWADEIRAAIKEAREP